MAGEADAFLLLILAFLFPPAAVAFLTGCSADLCLNILLTLLGYLPGCIHAFWLVLKRAEANEAYGRSNWTYTGMGEYFPRNQVPPPAPGSGPGAAPPPLTAAPVPGPYQQPSPGQAPTGQKQGGYMAPVQPVQVKSGYPGPPPEAPPEQQGGSMPPPMPSDQKQELAAPTGST